MEIALALLLGFALGILFTAWRLRGERPVMKTLSTVISGGGGPGEER